MNSVILISILVAIYILIGCVSIEVGVAKSCTSTRYRVFVLLCWPVWWVVYITVVIANFLKGS